MLHSFVGLNLAATRSELVFLPMDGLHDVHGKLS